MELETTSAAAGAPSNSQDLARVADELLEHTRALRAQYEQLRGALDGVAPAPGVPGEAGVEDDGDPTRERGPSESIEAMALQMALGGEERGHVKEQLLALGVEGAESIVDEVFDRIEARRAEGEGRKLFARRAR